MEKPGLYVHVPFCRSKCPYCGFFSVPRQTLLPRWIEAIRLEAGFHRGTFGVFDSLYFGGGTPSILALDDLESLMSTLRDAFDFEEDCEITLEANPGDLTPDKANLLRSLGVNRLVVGVQSLDDRVLRFLGRRHTAREARMAMENARNAGFPALCVDLIYGLGEPELDEAWWKTLSAVLTYQPEHLSCYLLSIEPRTPFFSRFQRSLLHRPSEKESARLFLRTSGFLEKNSYLHYEVSSFARSEALQARHNAKYWRRAPYLGLGPAAHSFQGRRRWWNVSSLRAYCDVLERGEMPLGGEEHLNGEQSALERVSLGLRMREGFPMDPPLMRRIPAEALHRLEQAGFIEQVEGRVRPTTKGLLVADRLPLELLS